MAITKKTSYSKEQELPISPARQPVHIQEARDWASASYDRAGRGHIFKPGPHSDEQEPKGSSVRDYSQRKARTRPGRW